MQESLSFSLLDFRKSNLFRTSQGSVYTVQILPGISRSEPRNSKKTDCSCIRKSEEQINGPCQLFWTFQNINISMTLGFRNFLENPNFFGFVIPQGDTGW